MDGIAEAHLWEGAWFNEANFFNLWIASLVNFLIPRFFATCLSHSPFDFFWVVLFE